MAQRSPARPSITKPAEAPESGPGAGTAERPSDETAGRRSTAHKRWRELRSTPTWVTVIACVLLGIPATLLVTPDQEVTIAGQQVLVGARPPTLSLSGPAQLVQVGNTELDIAPLKVFGPIRPRLTLGPVKRNAAAAAAMDPGSGGNVKQAAVSGLTNAFVRWYLWAGLILIGITLALVAVAGCGRMLLTMRRESRGRPEPLTATELWHSSRNQIRTMSVLAVVIALSAWGTAGAFAYSGAVNGLQHLSSLSDLVGRYYLTPSPVGPLVEGYTGAVIGDSRASRAGGSLVADPTAADKVCTRSSDSLARQVGSLMSTSVANLACPGATVANGLRGPQSQGGLSLPPQVGLLKQLTGVRFVVVMIGPNDLSWGDQLRYCYGVADCQDRLTEGEFAYRLSAFDRDYGDLLHDLNDLPGKPQIIVTTSYDLFAPDANCQDVKGPPGAVGLSADDLRLLISRNLQLNDVLTAGALKYGFSVARPVLTPLCQSTPDSLGPDLQGLDGDVPFHPTGIGVLRVASSVVRLIQPAAAKPGG